MTKETHLKKNIKKQSFIEYFKERSKSHIVFDVVMALYVSFCVGSLVYFAVLGGAHVRDCLIALSYIAVVPVFYLFEYFLHIRAGLPFTLFILIYCVFCFLGASFNFYTLIPFLDDILHMGWGVLFTALGFCIIKSLMGEPETGKQFAAYIIFSVGFCMILSILWEIYEFATDSIMPNFDMQEDTIVDHIHSFMLNQPYDHLHTWQVEGIAYTKLFDAEGNLIGEISGGYLDLGLIDTMMDLIWCLIMTVLFTVVLVIDRKLGSKLYPHIIPVYVGKRESTESILNDKSS